MLDDWGLHGEMLHYGLIFMIVGGALIAFLYFWSKGGLDMDEEPKLQMMREEFDE